MRYSELDPKPVRATISVLARRIEERFPSSGALQAQHLQDAVVLEAVNEIESLSSDLSRKIWQKITILNAAQAAR